MGIKTEDFCKNIPPKELTLGIEWLRIFDDFDPAVLEQKYLNECARRYLIMIAHANPYWLFDPECDAYYAEEDPEHNAVKHGDEPCVYATIDVILRWITEGKPRNTCWKDGIR